MKIKLNSEKFHELRQYMEMYSGFEIQIKAPAKRKVELRGLTYEYMRTYHCFDVPFGHFIKSFFSIEIVAHVLHVVSVIANCNVRNPLCCLRYYEHLKYF